MLTPHNSRYFYNDGRQQVHVNQGRCEVEWQVCPDWAGQGVTHSANLLVVEIFEDSEV